MKTICIGILAITVLLITQMVAAKPPSWDTVNNGKRRFKLLTQFGSAAVLDQETVLVWEQSPSLLRRDWATAPRVCAEMTKGNRKGWRLPTIEELASLS